MKVCTLGVTDRLNLLVVDNHYGCSLALVVINSYLASIICYVIFSVLMKL
jgi:hypothetical protein